MCALCNVLDPFAQSDLAQVMHPEGETAANIAVIFDALADVNGAQADTLFAPSARMDLGGGSDVINGMAASETLTGTSVADTIFGGGGNDTLFGGQGSDTLFGGADNDTLVYLDTTGFDSFDGGAGIDVLQFNSSAATTFNFGSSSGAFLGVYGTTGGALSHNFSGIEQFQMTGTGDETFIGAFINVLSIDGGAGVDTIDLSQNTANIATMGTFFFDVDQGYSNTGGASYNNVWSNIENLLTFGSVATTMIGNSVANALTGSIHNDVLFGELGNDILTGGNGNDALFGGGDDDALFGGIGSDTLTGADGDDTLFGGTDNDTLFGGLGTNTLSGGDGADTLMSVDGSGYDSLNGGNGVDTLHFDGTGDTTFDFGASLSGDYGATGGALSTTFSGIETFVMTGTGNETFVGNFVDGIAIDGGAGIDTIDLSGNTTSRPTEGIYFLDIDKGFSSNSGATYTNVWNNFENLTGFANTSITMFGNSADNALTGSNLNDILHGELGNDTLSGGAGGDTLYGGGGINTLFGGNGDDTLVSTGGADFDHLYGGNGIDTLHYDGSGDTTFDLSNSLGSAYLGVFGATGGSLLNDVARIETFLMTGTGNETFIGDDLYDLSIDGGAGVDTIDLSNNSANLATAGVHFLDVDQGYSGDGGASYTNVWANIENLIGFGSVSITMIGNEAKNALTGSIHSDVLMGELGDDTLTGGAGIDTLYGGDGDDALHIQSGTDFDHVFGGIGTDTLWVDMAGDVTFDAGLNLWGASGGTLTYMLDDIEAVTMTSTGNDTFTGQNIAAMAIDGGAGIDTIDLSANTGDWPTLGQYHINLIHGLSMDSGATFLAGWNNIENVIGFATMAMNVLGNSSANALTGSIYGDIILGGGGNDAVFGGGGGDDLSGGLGTDSVYGGDGDDTLIYQEGMGFDHLFGGTGVDEVQFDTTTDTTFNIDLMIYGLTGTTLTNTLEDIESFDMIGVGNTTFLGELLVDYTIKGGAGIDTIDQSSRTLVDAIEGLIILDLTLGYSDDGGATYVKNWFGIENLVTFGAVASTLIGDGGDNELTGSTQKDDLFGGGGHDYLNGGANNDDLNGDGGNDILNGAGGNDTVIGGTGKDDLIGGGGNDVLFGGDDNDTVRGGVGADSMSGGTGSDTLSYTSDTIGVNVNLSSNIVSGGNAEGDTIASFESVKAGSGDNMLIGTISANAIISRGGNDSLYGLDGDDRIAGGGGDDLLRGDGGGDILNGGGGTDTLSYATDTIGVNVDIGLNTASGGHATGDTISRFENLTGGTGDDILRGSGGDNVINGGSGNDRLSGRTGDDTLIGGAGTDTLNGGEGMDVLTGGTGADVFIFSGTTNDDTITDFEVGIDTLKIYGQVEADVTFGDTGGGGTLITLASGDTILVENTSIADLNTFDDFQFV